MLSKKSKLTPALVRHIPDGILRSVCHRGNVRQFRIVFDILSDKWFINNTRLMKHYVYRSIWRGNIYITMKLLKYYNDIQDALAFALYSRRYKIVDAIIAKYAKCIDAIPIQWCLMLHSSSMVYMLNKGYKLHNVSNQLNDVKQIYTIRQNRIKKLERKIDSVVKCVKDWPVDLSAIIADFAVEYIT